MKRIIALLISAVLVFSCVACKKTEVASESQTTVSATKSEFEKKTEYYSNPENIKIPDVGFNMKMEQLDADGNPGATFSITYYKGIGCDFNVSGCKACMYVVDGKEYVRLDTRELDGGSDEWYVATIPEGENPLENDTTSSITGKFDKEGLQNARFEYFSSETIDDRLYDIVKAYVPITEEEAEEEPEPTNETVSLKEDFLHRSNLYVNAASDANAIYGVNPEAESSEAGEPDGFVMAENPDASMEFEEYTLTIDAKTHEVVMFTAQTEEDGVISNVELAFFDNGEIELDKEAQEVDYETINTTYVMGIFALLLSVATPIGE